MAKDPLKERLRTRATLTRHLGELRALDPRLAPVIAASGDIPMRRGKGGFAGLAGIVGAQQLSVASANAIMGRVERLLGEMTAGNYLRAREKDLRACGLSGPKLRTLTAIAEADAAGRIAFGRLPRMPAEEAIAHLIELHGVGTWTAEIYLLFHLSHADIFPAGDLALQKMVGTALRRRARPDEKACRRIAEAWSPYRSAAARLLWRYFAVLKSREGIAA